MTTCFDLPKSVLSPDLIIETTAGFYKKNRYMLVGIDRHHSLKLARHVAIYLVRKHTLYSLSGIGKIFCNRDHTTIMNSIRYVRGRLDGDEVLRRHVAYIERDMGVSA